MPTSTTLFHILPVISKNIAGWEIMYFFATKGMMAAKRKAASRTMITTSAQHAATFGKSIVK